MTAVPADLYPEFAGNLNVADLDVVHDAAGPGRRLVVWVQGCLKRCPGCRNGPFLSERRAQVLTVDELWAALDRAGVEGLTLSGGEPVLQATALVPLLERVRAAGLTTVCYTGYTLEELRGGDQAGRFAAFLDLVDLLIDGEYQAEVPRGGVYRPSGNQRLHFLSGRITAAHCTDVVETEVRLSGGRGRLTGTLPAAMRRRLASALRVHGIKL